MAYTYDITTSKKDKKAIFGLSYCNLILTIVDLFLSTFLIAYIYQGTKTVFEYVYKVGVFNIITYIAMIVSYHLCSKIVAKTNRIGMYRFAIVVYVAYVLFAIFFGKDLSKLISLAGLINGLAKGIYYSSYNVLRQEMVSRNSINGFSTVMMALQKIIDVVFPITLGALIEVSTYSKTAIIVLVLCLSQLVASFFIRAKKPEGSNYEVIDYLKRLKQNPELNKKMKFMYLICFIFGFSNLMKVVFIVFTMFEFGSSLSFGTIKSVLSIVNIVLTILVGKFTFEGKRKWVFLSCIGVMIVGLMSYLIFPGKIGWIACYSLISFAGIPCSLIIEVLRNKFLKEAGMYQDIAEHQGVVETMFCIMRITLFGVMILLSLFHSMLAFKILLVISALGYMLIPVMFMLFEQKFYNRTENEQNAISQDTHED